MLCLSFEHQPLLGLTIQIHMPSHQSRADLMATIVSNHVATDAIKRHAWVGCQSCGQIRGGFLPSAQRRLLFCGVVDLVMPVW